MVYIEIYWDLDEDPDGNVAHLQEHDISVDEFEEVFYGYRSEATVSNSTGLPITFGWTSTGRYLAIVWEFVSDDPLAIYPVTAYDVEPPA